LTGVRDGWDLVEEDAAVVNRQLMGLIDLVVREVCE